jgi:CheY-specific phosphatase CheX
MSARFFGQFLLAHGLVKNEQLQQAVAYQQGRNVKLGELAVFEGLLTREQADRIHLEQRRRDAPFGRVAEELGLLSRVQIDALIEIQERQHCFIGEALQAVGAVSQAEIDAALETYKRQEQEVERTHIAPSRDAVAWATGEPYTSIVQCTARVLRRVADAVSKPGVTRELVDELPAAEAQAGLQLSGDWRGELLLRTSDAFAAHLASRLLDEMRPSAELTADALRELTSIVGGTVVGSVESLGSIEVSPPESYPSGQPIEIAGRKAVLFTLVTTRGPLEVGVVVAR